MRLLQVHPQTWRNNEYRYILIDIDCYPKYVWTEAITTKTAKDVSENQTTGTKRVTIFFKESTNRQWN